MTARYQPDCPPDRFTYALQAARNLLGLALFGFAANFSVRLWGFLGWDMATWPQLVFFAVTAAYGAVVVVIFVRGFRREYARWLE